MSTLIDLLKAIHCAAFQVVFYAKGMEKELGISLNGIKELEKALHNYEIACKTETLRNGKNIKGTKENENGKRRTEITRPVSGKVGGAAQEKTAG
jgi:hypothetical protein